MDIDFQFAQKERFQKIIRRLSLSNGCLYAQGVYSRIRVSRILSGYTRWSGESIDDRKYDHDGGGRLLQVR